MYHLIENIMLYLYIFCSATTTIAMIIKKGNNDAFFISISTIMTIINIINMITVFIIIMITRLDHLKLNSG